MKEFFINVLFSRGVQLSARYVAMGMVALLAWFKAKGHEAPIDTGAVNATAETVAGILLTGFLVLWDHLSHHVNAKTEDVPPEKAPGGGTVPFSILLLPLAGLLLVCASGCMRQPKEVTEGRNLARSAYLNVNANNNRIIETLITAYRDAQYAAIDAAAEQDKAAALKKAEAEAAAGRPVTPAQVLEFADKLQASKKAKYDEVNGRITELRAAIDKGQSDLLVAAKLEEALDRFDAAGVDMSAATNAVDKILAIVGKKGGK